LTVTARIRPAGPYSLALTAQGGSDATRIWRDGVLRGVVGDQQASATQLRDGTVVLRGPSEDSVEGLRWMLAVDDDHTEFLRRFKRDELLRGPIAHLQGKRVLRVGTVAQALLRALCGQLIEAWRARALEKRIIRSLSTPVGDLHRAPDTKLLGRCSPAELRALGLHARRGATLARLCRSLELERLRDVSSPIVAERLGRERGLGAWSVGVVCLEGLGRREYGLVGDLGLVKLCTSLLGRRAESEDTRTLLEPYGEWAGLASVYMLARAA
jgi:3-methyladenine DNA glycosylase/8-oxoguanine DNA glycosylase